jgi:tRNA A-37 threonylcarbamoyl transferase component Bud32
MGSGLATGTIFAGRYRIVRPIAAGGMGAVYEVIHLETERRRALKVMLPHILQSEELRERFQREAKVAAHVESEFIVDVFDAGFDAETQMPFLVMELLRGEELNKRLKRMRRLPPTEVVAFLYQTALALEKTHRGNIVHRDLKPENLFLTEREDGPPRIKVLDFGIAKIVAENATSGATQSLGTPLYMAPEQFDPRARITGATDLYALGMVAFTLLAGASYWAEEARGGNVFALANVAIHGPRDPASVRAALRGVTLPPAFDAWFARATAADPTRRFAGATEMIAAMAVALGVPVPGRSASLSMSGVGSGHTGNAGMAMPVRVVTGPGPVGSPMAAMAQGVSPSAASPPWAATGYVPPDVTSAGAPTVFTPAGFGAGTFAAATPPPQTHSTGPATTSTTSMPMVKGRGVVIAIGAAMTLGVLGGAGVYLAMRSGGDAADKAYAGSATTDGVRHDGGDLPAPPGPAGHDGGAEPVVKGPPVVPVTAPAPVPDTAASATSTTVPVVSAAPAVTSSVAVKVEEKATPPARPTASLPGTGPSKKKYTRD